MATAVRGLDVSARTARLSIAFGKPNHIDDEVIVSLLLDAWRGNHTDADFYAAELLRRTTKHVRAHVRKNPGWSALGGGVDGTTEDFCQEVMVAILKDQNVPCHAERAFGDFVWKRCLDQAGKLFAKKNSAGTQLDVDDVSSENGVEENASAHRSAEEQCIELEEDARNRKLEEAIRQIIQRDLPERPSIAITYRYLAGMKIDSKNASEVTVSRLMGVHREDRFKVHPASNRTHQRKVEHMTNRKQNVTLDDVLAEYANANNGFDAQLLQELVERYPEYAPALNRYAQVQLSSISATPEEINSEVLTDDQMLRQQSKLLLRMQTLRKLESPAALVSATKDRLLAISGEKALREAAIAIFGNCHHGEDLLLIFIKDKPGVVDTPDWVCNRLATYVQSSTQLVCELLPLHRFSHRAQRYSAKEKPQEAAPLSWADAVNQCIYDAQARRALLTQ